MSMQLVGGTIGAVIGASFGMPQIGWMLGSMIGGTFAPNQVTAGPRLGDTRVQLSTYGKVMPQIFGTARISGNVIWSTGLLETAHVSSTGGKGGGGGQTQISYTYAASFALSLCSTTAPDGANTPISGIGRIWADGQLIANFGSVDPNTIMASYQTAGGKDGPGVGYQASGGSVVYLGTETQNPDPTMQAYLGAANVPAYRGQAYIVFNNFQLQKFGNRIPNIEVEVICSGAISNTVTQLATPAGFINGTIASYTFSLPYIPSTTGMIAVVGSYNSPAIRFVRISASNATIIGTATLPSVQPFSVGEADEPGVLVAAIGTQTYYWVTQYSTKSFTLPNNDSFGYDQARYVKTGNLIYMSSTLIGSKKVYCISLTTGATLAESLPLANQCRISADSSYIYCLETFSPGAITRLDKVTLQFVDRTILDRQVLSTGSEIKVANGNIYIALVGVIYRAVGGVTSAVYASGGSVISYAYGFFRRRYCNVKRPLFTVGNKDYCSDES